MAIIYSYPTATPLISDFILGTQPDPVTDENKTVQFQIGQIAALTTQNYLETTVTVTAAQLNALQATNVVLIPQPGLNNYIRVLNVTFYFDYVAPQYTFAANTQLVIGAIPFFTIPGSKLSAAADSVQALAMATGDITANTALVLQTGGTVTGSGNGTLQIKIRYQVLNTSSF